MKESAICKNELSDFNDQFSVLISKVNDIAKWKYILVSMYDKYMIYVNTKRRKIYIYIYKVERKIN